MSKIVEEWKDIPGYEGKYQVSDWGRVRDTNYRNRNIVKIRKLQTNEGGYKYLRITQNGTIEFYFVHRLVYETFVGEIPPGYQINHIDENESNNVLWNLNIMTPKENCNWGSHNKNISLYKLNFHPRAVKIDQIDQKTGEVLKEYPSAKRTENHGFDSTNVIRCCNGKYKQHKGYIWKRHLICNT